MSGDIKECPSCGTINGDSAVYCDCGFDLSHYSPEDLRAVAGERHGSLFRLYLLGVVFGTAAFVALLAVGYFWSYLLAVPILCAFLAIRSYYAAKANS